MVHAPPGTVEQALDALRIRIVDSTTPAWHDGYGHARAWQQQHRAPEHPERLDLP